MGTTPLNRINGYAHVALRYGLEEAIFLDSLMFWYKENKANDRNYRDDRWWTYNSVGALSQMFPWWSAKQIRRITENCREKGAVLTENYNEDQKDRTLWYTPSDELLELYGMSEEGNCICPNGQAHLPKRADTFAQTGKCINNEHVKTSVETSVEETDAVFDEYAGEDRELRHRLADFQESRRKKKKPLHTRRAAKILVDKLERLSDGDRACKLALLDNAILHGWESVYPLKDDERPGAPPGSVWAQDPEVY